MLRSNLDARRSGRGRTSVHHAADTQQKIQNVVVGRCCFQGTKDQYDAVPTDLAPLGSPAGGAIGSKTYHLELRRDRVDRSTEHRNFRSKKLAGISLMGEYESGGSLGLQNRRGLRKGTGRFDSYTFPP
jgi:hypothetical protein